MTYFIDLCRSIVRQYDAVNGRGAALADSIGGAIVLTGFAIIAIGVAAITGDA